ncbi:hypothetical protein AY601_0051 [Pedobacter cryoconitis]|uniref:Uncharacterized protein n=1 Tax=Pedobacter cryoconitis TaxID=188932 RepID=A0A127V6X9_9SPHI|nr:hypothetical protein [Pedobacter cryoconitis]AMP97024.1 hypothetical protein AY601_0051 [Pedobacter cryoconitis]
MMNVIIFKTSVQDRDDLDCLRPALNAFLGEKNWTFDLEDVDKILRVVSPLKCTIKIEQLLLEQGFLCIEMPYSLDEFSA